MFWRLSLAMFLGAIISLPVFADDAVVVDNSDVAEVETVIQNQDSLITDSENETVEETPEAGEQAVDDDTDSEANTDETPEVTEQESVDDDSETESDGEPQVTRNVRPDYEDLGNVHYDSLCTAATFGVTGGSIDVSAMWEPLKYKCERGEFLDSSDALCKTCRPGYYCPGFGLTSFNDTDLGLENCPDTYTSDAGNRVKTECYRLETADCNVLNSYTYGHGTPNYRELSGTPECKRYYVENESDSRCRLTDSDACVIASLNCEIGYEQAEIDGHLECVRARIACNEGEYLPRNGVQCKPCAEDNYCVGGTFEHSTGYDQGITACPAKLFSPEGSRVVEDCGHILHVGDDIKLYLHATPRTTPSLRVEIDGEIWYGDLTEITEEGKAIPISVDTDKIMRVDVDGKKYTIHNSRYTTDTEEETESGTESGSESSGASETESGTESAPEND